MGTLVTLVAYVAAIFWLIDSKQDGFWWLVCAALAISGVVTAIVQFGSPREARDSPRSHDMFSSPAARALLLPMGIINVGLVALVIYAFWIR